MKNIRRKLAEENEELEKLQRENDELRTAHMPFMLNVVTSSKGPTWYEIKKGEAVFRIRYSLMIALNSANSESLYLVFALSDMFKLVYCIG